MYKISVPVRTVTVNENNREAVLYELRRFDADRVILTLGNYVFDKEERGRLFEKLKQNCAFFKSRGLEVSSWCWAFTNSGSDPFGNMRTLSGAEHPERVCPADERFLSFVKEYVKGIAACGVDMIMFDDDLRYEFFDRTTPACLCDRHIGMINGITGEKLDRETLAERILTGGKNKYRDAWLTANGELLRGFARAVREAIDEVDPNIRAGACACMGSWDIDGVTPDELARIFAGKTKPFYRLIGAPYWAVRNSFGCALQDVIELERMESSWTREPDIEIFAEGDAYPRPRYNCPASYLEGFDTAIRASGCTDGIQKYGIDYTSNIDYETGYAAFHERNRDIYRKIDEMFGGKKHCGVRVYETMRKVADIEMTTAVNKTADLEALFQSKAARTLAHNAIPSTYEGEGVCGIVFDENARALPLSALKGGLIIDIAAAEILQSRGIDVGVISFGEERRGNVERFANTGNEIVHSFTGVTVFDNKFSDKIEILSRLKTPQGEIPLSYRYENAAGNRFLVFNVNSRPDGEGKSRGTRFGPENVLRNYARSRQIANCAEWLSGKKLPAYVYGCPDMYLQCKQGDGGMAAGIWNFFADEAFDITVELGKAYSSVRFLNCAGRLLGDRVVIDRVPAFGFAFFEVKE